MAMEAPQRVMGPWEILGRSTTESMGDYPLLKHGNGRYTMYIYIYNYINYIGDFPIETTVSSGFPSASHVETKEGRRSSWDSLFPLLTKPMRKGGDIMIQ